MIEDTYINEYKVDPAQSGGWWLRRKRLEHYNNYDGTPLSIPREYWETVNIYSSMRQVEKAIKHLSTPTKYFQIGTV